jgi:DNA-binding transcriptional ArsR family regulator
MVTYSTRRDPFQAIADPHRREILSLLVGRPLTVKKLAENFRISRPAVSKHVKILAECGLVTVEQKGRERHCSARFDRLSEVNDWVGQYRRFWEEKLDALDVYLKELQSKEERP